MAPARSLSPVTTTPPEPICTTASKRFAGAISMSLLVPLLEFNRCWKTRVGLETLRDQAEIFDRFNDEQNEQYLLSTLSGLPSYAMLR